MKAIQLSNIKKLDIINIDKPSIKNDKDVLIKVKKVGICGSDVHYYNTGRIGNQIVKYPFIIGHEMSGIIEKIGKKVSRVKENDKIAVDPLIHCNQCDQCKIGRYHTCRNHKFLGCPDQIEGCLKEYIVLPENCCYRIPDKISYDTAILIEPLSIGFYSTSFADSLKDKKIAILGVGPIGLSVLIISKALKSSKIYTTDLLDYRLTTAKKHGADWTGNPQSIDCVKEILNLEPYQQLDCIFECCGKQEAIEQGLNLLKPGGKLIIIGIPDFENFYFNSHLIRRNEITIHNVRRQNEYINKTIDYISDNIINPSFMITHQFSLLETAKAFQLVSNYEENVIKAIINIE